MSNTNPNEILTFWFSTEIRPLWFDSNPEFDYKLRLRFEATYLAAIEGALNEWTDSPKGSLALVIVLDQFPLNMYRGRAESYSSGPLAVGVASSAVEKGFDQSLSREQLPFLYLPFMHSEVVEDQMRSVQLFQAADLKENLRFALHHQEILRRFGRFPHRNSALGRTSTAEEIAYLQSKEGYQG